MNEFEAFNSEIIIDIKHNPKSKNVYTKYYSFSKLTKELGLKKTMLGSYYNDLRVDRDYISLWLNSNYIPLLPSGVSKVSADV